LIDDLKIKIGHIAGVPIQSHGRSLGNHSGVLREDLRRASGEINPQRTAFFTSAAILVSAVAVNSFSAKTIGMAGFLFSI
jgi:hypothetical protein